VPSYTTTTRYVRNDLKIAAFLRVTGHRLLGTNTSDDGEWVEFLFSRDASKAVENYDAGMQVPAKVLFAAYEDMKVIITRVTDAERIGDRSWNT
jgi:hypothetical protein